MRLPQSRNFITAFLLPFFPLFLSAQNFVVDNVLFWENADWDHTDVIYREDGDKKIAWVVRRYYGDRHDIREEFLRMDADNWLFNSYDTSGAFHFRRGRMRVDRAHPRIDTIVTFDPETFEERIRLDTTWRLLEEGHWWEADGRLHWRGDYAGGVRQGLWEKYFFDWGKIPDYRTVQYENGRPGEEIQHNLALRADSTALLQALTGSWALCKSQKYHKWMK